jgi:hypothetical protein
MVGRALERDVERDLEPERARPRNQPPKVVEKKPSARAVVRSSTGPRR